jgi:hypothetical protein
MRLPNGAWVTVHRFPDRPDRAEYRARLAVVFGDWPPRRTHIDECCRWS